MLDENLPVFFYKLSPDGLQHNTAIFLSQHGSDPEPAYSLQRADPSAAYARNCYAAAIFDSFNPEVLYGEVLIKPEWTQPSLSAEEIRRNNGVPPPPFPILPTEFIIQLYNPDQQVVVAQKPGSWGGSASYEFSLPQTTFRTPSASHLDRTQDDPAASSTTPKINFVWRKESKLARDLSCYMTGKSTDTLVKKKHRDPDIAIALYRSFREVTIYEPNLSRVEIEDPKGLEVVLLLGAAIIKDLYFSNTHISQIFNVSDATRPSSSGARRTSTGQAIPSGPSSPPLASTAGPSKRKRLSQLQTTPSLSPPPTNTNNPPVAAAAPPPVDPRIQWEIDAETARLRAQVEAEERASRQAEAARRREQRKADEAETRRLRRMVEAEEREAAKKQEAIDRETERLRREYGAPPAQAPAAVPPRGGRHSAPVLTLGAIHEGQGYQRPQGGLLQPAQSAGPPVRGPNGLYLQPSGHASSSAVMSGGNPGAVSAEAKRMKKKSFFGLRSSSDDGERKLQKKTSAMWS